MPERRRVLLLSAPIGAGHLRAAYAVSSALRQQGVEARVINIFDTINPLLGKTLLKIYLNMLAWFPKIYGQMYDWGNESRWAVAGRKIISCYLAKKVHQQIVAYQPAVIVCTHATPAGLVAYLAKKEKLTAPAVAIITDFVVHRLWVYPEIAHYFVAHAAMVERLAGLGIDKKKVHPTGIPIDPAFLRPKDKRQILSSFNLAEDRKTVLIMGGGAGVLPMEEIIAECDKLDEPLQIIAVAGSNRVLQSKITARLPFLRQPVRVVGFVDAIPELMTVADILISKPGGMTSSEALCSSLPLIIYRPIPGQEQANAAFLVNQQTALEANSPPAVAAMLKLLLFDQPEQLLKYQQHAARISRPTAAQDIAQYISSLFCLTSHT